MMRKNIRKILTNFFLFFFLKKRSNLKSMTWKFTRSIAITQMQEGGGKKKSNTPKKKKEKKKKLKPCFLNDIKPRRIFSTLYVHHHLLHKFHSNFFAFLNFS